MPPSAPLCTRPGCGQLFSAPGPCSHHSGAPVFHEGLKSWSCCNETHKPVLEFDQFLAIPPCASADAHSDVKPKKPEPKAAPSVAPSATANGGTEVFGAAAPKPAVTQPAAPLSAAALAAAAKVAKQETVEKPEEQDPPEVDGSALAQGTPCKRAGCSVKFEGGKRDRAAEKCTYHKGTAVFHEGSKGYTCCRRRVLDFADFLTIAGCTDAAHGHLFAGTEPVKQAPADGIERVEARIDHYETPADVRVTVYAKGCDADASSVQFDESEVKIALALPDAPSGSKRRYERVLRPFAPIDAAASSFRLTKFKLDLVLVKKSANESWPTLESGERALGWGNTFGRK